MNPILFLQLYYYLIWFVQLYWNLMLMSFEDKNTCAILSWFYCSMFIYDEYKYSGIPIKSQFTIKFKFIFISATPVFACRRQWSLTAKYFCWLSAPAPSEPPYSLTRRLLRLLPEIFFSRNKKRFLCMYKNGKTDLMHSQFDTVA